MAAFNFEFCESVELHDIGVEGADTAVSAKFVQRLSVDGLEASRVNEVIRASNVDKVTLKNIRAEVGQDLLSAVAVQVALGDDFGKIRATFGDRLKGRGFDLDAWLSRLGNGAAVLAFILQLAARG